MTDVGLVEGVRNGRVRVLGAVAYQVALGGTFRIVGSQAKQLTQEIAARA